MKKERLTNIYLISKNKQFKKVCYKYFLFLSIPLSASTCATKNNPSEGDSSKLEKTVNQLKDELEKHKNEVSIVKNEVSIVKAKYEDLENGIVEVDKQRSDNYKELSLELLGVEKALQDKGLI